MMQDGRWRKKTNGPEGPRGIPSEDAIGTKGKMQK